MHGVKCGKCKEFLPRESFYKNRSKANGLQDFCKECTNMVVRNYKEEKKKGLDPIRFCACGRKLSKRMLDDKCGKCKHREKMRAKYHENPEYHKAKNLAWRNRRNANKEIELETPLTKAEIMIVNNFKHDWLSLGRRMEKVFKEEIEHLQELGFIKVREVNGMVEYALMENGLRFLGIATLENGND